MHLNSLCQPRLLVIIGDNIRVAVLSVRGSQVRLGFEAPVEVPIRRDELLRLCPATKEKRISAADCCGRGLPCPSGV
jgi:carbon storage regulator